MEDHQDVLADDLLDGASAIAEFVFNDKRKRSRVYYLCAKNLLPHFRLGERIFSRKSTLRGFVDEQEKARNHETA